MFSQQKVKGMTRMSKGRIIEALGKRKILLSDGAWGTLMYAKGLKENECPELWNITRYSDVMNIATEYVKAGSDMVMTNTLGANRFTLSNHSLQDKVQEINISAARASRQAAGDDVWVMASVGPTGKLLVMDEVTELEIYEAYKEQVVALEKGGCDAVCIETMSDLEETLIAIRAAKENTSLEVIASFTYTKTPQGEYRTMMGITPKQGAIECIKAGADIIGTNCGNGIEQMIGIVEEIKQALPDAYVLVQANAGLPENIDGKVVYSEGPEYMAQFIEPLIEAGANIIGGCCGTTPEHIHLMRKVLDGINA